MAPQPCLVRFIQLLGGSHEIARRFTGSPDAGPPARRVWVVLPRGARAE